MFLDFVEGPLWYVAVTVFLVGVVLRLIDIFRQRSRAEYAPSRDGGFVGGLRTVVTRSWPAPGFGKGAVYHIFAGYMFHIGLFILVLFAAPHVVFIEERILGFAWEPASYWVFIVSAEFAFAGLTLVWLRRVLHPVQKKISTFDDHAAAIITFLVMLTGCMALGESHDGLRALHMLCVDIFLIYFPFSRLMHAFTFAISRAKTGATMARKGVAA